MSDEISLEAYNIGNGLVFAFGLLDIQLSDLDVFKVIDGKLGYHENKKIGIRNGLITLRLDYDGSKVHWNFELPKEIIKNKIKIYENNRIFNNKENSIIKFLKKITEQDIEKYITIKFRIDCSSDDKISYENYVNSFQKHDNLPSLLYNIYEDKLKNGKFYSFKVD